MNARIIVTARRISDSLASVASGETPAPSVIRWCASVMLWQVAGAVDRWTE